MGTGFKFGRQSRARLAGVLPALVDVATLAISRSLIDFSVVEGVRTAERQAELRARGASQVAVSKHQAQADGYGHALDLVPWVAGRMQWELVPQCDVAAAMGGAAVELGVRVRWGGNWKVLEAGDGRAQLAAVRAYIDARRAAGRTPFVDAWHFEVR